MAPSLLIEKLPATLADFPQISLLYLFGSQVTGQTGPLSDYDVAILVDSKEDLYTLRAGFQHAIVKALETDRVDIILLNRVPIELAYQIIATGMLIYKRNTYTQVEFEAQVLGKYGDYLPVLKMFKEQILRGDTNDRRSQRYREALGRTRRATGAVNAPPRAKAR